MTIDEKLQPLQLQLLADGQITDADARAGDADDLAPAGVVHGVGDAQRLAPDAAAVADLLDLGVQPQLKT